MAKVIIPIVVFLSENVIAKAVKMVIVIMRPCEN